MAKVSIHTEINPDNFMVFQKLMKAFPDIRASLLGYVGNEGKRLLYNTFLRGQELQYKGMTDSRGRRTVGYSVGRRANYVSIRSYPANLFEKGRLLRSGEREKGKYIITRKFKSVMNSALNGILNQYDMIYLQRKLDKVA